MDLFLHSAVYYMNFNIFIIILMSDCVVVILFQSSCANLWSYLVIMEKVAAASITKLSKEFIILFKPFSSNLFIPWFKRAVSSQQQVSGQLVTVFNFYFYSQFHIMRTCINKCQAQCMYCTSTGTSRQSYCFNSIEVKSMKKLVTTSHCGFTASK